VCPIGCISQRVSICLIALAIRASTFFCSFGNWFFTVFSFPWELTGFVAFTVGVVEVAGGIIELPQALISERPL